MAALLERLGKGLVCMHNPKYFGERILYLCFTDDLACLFGGSVWCAADGEAIRIILEVDGAFAYS